VEAGANAEAKDKEAIKNATTFMVDIICYYNNSCIVCKGGQVSVGVAFVAAAVVVIPLYLVACA